MTRESAAFDLTGIQPGRCVRPEGLHGTLYTELIIMLVWGRLGKLQAQTVVYTE